MLGRRALVVGALPPGHVEGEGKRLPTIRLGQAPAKAVIPVYMGQQALSDQETAFFEAP